MEIHITKSGVKIPINKLEDSHLLSIINFIKKKSEEGVTYRFGGGLSADDMWYEEEIIFGKKAKKILGYKKYKQELERRNRNDTH
jgi:hypothetical protein